MLFDGGFSFSNFLVDVLAVFMFVVWFWLLITVFGDLFRRHDISGWGKASLGDRPDLDSVHRHLRLHDLPRKRHGGAKCPVCATGTRRRCGVSSDSVPLMRSRSSMGSRGQDRSARTNSGTFAPSWFNSRTIAGCARFVLVVGIDPEISIQRLRAERRSCAPLLFGKRGTSGAATHTCNGEDPDVTQR